jgi:hypothetical protein
MISTHHTVPLIIRGQVIEADACYPTWNGVRSATSTM